jgi:outer membrane immunogenic protein
MRKLLLGVVAITTIGAGSALAADMPVKAIYKAPPVYAPYSWTGCFVGGNGGGLWLHKDASLPVATALAVPGVGALAAPAGTSFGGHDASSAMGGFQVGCDYQFAGNWVIGIQGDYDWANAVGSHVDTFLPIITDRSRTTSLGTVTGRIGYAWDRFLGYVRGGYAWERDAYDSYITATATTFATASETRGGWTVGIGGEYAFTNWLSGFAEYDHYEFGTRTNTFTIVTGGTIGIDVRERKDVVRVGLNLRWGGGPVVARY